MTTFLLFVLQVTVSRCLKANNNSSDVIYFKSRNFLSVLIFFIITFFFFFTKICKCEMPKFILTFHRNNQFSRKIEPVNIYRRRNLQKLHSANTITFTVLNCLAKYNNIQIPSPDKQWVWTNSFKVYSPEIKHHNIYMLQCSTNRYMVIDNVKQNRLVCK